MAFKSQFEPTYVQRLDAGELECLTHLFANGGTHLVASGDAIVYRTLGNAGRNDQGISLEEILDKVGQSPGKNKIRDPFRKGFRDRYTQQGFVEAQAGRGFRKKA